MWRHGNVCVSGTWPVTLTHPIMQCWEIWEALTSPGSWQGCAVCVRRVVATHLERVCCCTAGCIKGECTHCKKICTSKLKRTASDLYKSSKKHFSSSWSKSTFKTDFLQRISVALLYKLKRLVCVCFLFIWNAPAVVWSVWCFPADYACSELSHDVCVTSASEWNWYPFDFLFTYPIQVCFGIWQCSYLARVPLGSWLS